MGQVTKVATRRAQVVLPTSAGLVSFTMGSAALAGWNVDPVALRELHPAGALMRPSTALGLVLCGLALSLAAHRAGRPWLARVAAAAMAVSASVGLVALYEHAIGAGAAMDRALIAADPSVAAHLGLHKMPVSVALAFVLVAAGLLASMAPTTRLTRFVSETAFALTFLIGLDGLVLYAYGVAYEAGVVAATRMALPTGLALIALGVGGLWLRPERGAGALLTGDGAGSQVSRRLLPAAIAVPLLLGWARLYGERTGLYAGDYGVSLHALASVTLLCGVTLWTAYALERSDRGRRQAEMALRRERDAAEAANRELESFSYAVSHDLRAPLRSLDGFSQALLEDYADKLDARGRDYLGRIRAAAQRMGGLIDDLLGLARVSHGELQRAEVDVTRLARELADELQGAEPGRQVEVAIGDGLTANADPKLLRVTLANLLGNAWKFTGKNARARVEVGSTRAGGGQLAYYVRDDGAGFDMAYAGKLFGAFQRLHAATEFPGTGIGLATVQRIVHRHGGQVWAEGAVGAGATFYFTL